MEGIIGLKKGLYDAILVCRAARTWQAVHATTISLRWLGRQVRGLLALPLPLPHIQCSGWCVAPPPPQPPPCLRTRRPVNSFRRIIHAKANITATKMPQMTMTYHAVAKSPK
jgi:hypothetical protein